MMPRLWKRISRSALATCDFAAIRGSPPTGPMDGRSVVCEKVGRSVFISPYTSNCGFYPRNRLNGQWGENSRPLISEYMSALWQPSLLL
jgi:hypothetical protein